MHDLVAVALVAVWAFAGITAVAIALCVSAARGDRALKEAWDRDRDHQAAALGESRWPSGQ